MLFRRAKFGENVGFSVFSVFGRRGSAVCALRMPPPAGESPIMAEARNVCSLPILFSFPAFVIITGTKAKIKLFFGLFGRQQRTGHNGENTLT